jgi:hypothetical protein
MKNITLLFAVIILLSGCDNIFDTKDCNQTYVFSIPFTIFPAKDTFQIGDTLWLESIIPDELTDKLTGKSIPVRNFDFKIESFILRMDTLVQAPDGKMLQPSASNDFSYLMNYGEFQIKDFSIFSVIKAHYEQENNNQKLRIGIIPIKRGLFEIEFNNLTDDLTNVNLTDGDCYENLELSYQMNENEEDNNYHLLLDSPGQITSPEGFKQFGGYAFWVK